MEKYFALTSDEVTEAERQHMALSRRGAADCMVLLENEGSLPLREAGRIALYGNGARHTVKGGTGSGDVNSRTVVTIEQGLLEAGFTITTGAWMERDDEKRRKAVEEYDEFVAEKCREEKRPELAIRFDYPMEEAAPALVTREDVTDSGTETAIYVIARNSGEGADRHNRRGDYRLYEEELENLKLLGSSYQHVIVVLNIGGIMDLSELREIPGITAVLLMTQLGNIGGNALADVLTGAVTPSGKLADTWAVRYEDYPSSEGFSHNDGDVDDEYYTEGIYVGYRYFDTFGVKPLYPFGFGRSYTEFSLETTSVEVIRGRVQVSVDVKNIGDTYAGKEVVQIYYSAPGGALGKPEKELCAFAKTELLQPGEEELLIITFPVTDMASYSQEKAAWVLEAGSYRIRVGASSAQTVLVAELQLDRTVITEQLSNRLPLDCELKELAPENVNAGREELASENINASREETAPVVIELKAADFVTEHASYSAMPRKQYPNKWLEHLTLEHVKAGDCTVEDLTAQLTIEELAELCVGTQRGFGGSSAVGSSSNMIPGAAGDTTAALEESRGIRKLVFADGPAGLRLQPHFKTDREGNLLPGGEVFGATVNEFAPSREGEVDYYQYCTAIPIGWALAQSWDTVLMSELGSMVGSEMEQFGIDLWLAPAMNIHRNPLCGRNFEYYSEDPLVSGKAAAAITRGVQSHRGCGTTIKHFAVNNQEDNRYFTNSHVSERALREIYLKGFEIAVKEAMPMSIMTSYNLLNGVHTANSYDLIQAIARDEWGFGGVVMTDWYTSQKVDFITGPEKKYPISASTGCIYAGNDIQMPGCQKNVDDLVEAVATGEELDGYRIGLADLQAHAANVIKAVLKCEKVPHVF